MHKRIGVFMDNIDNNGYEVARASREAEDYANLTIEAEQKKKITRSKVFRCIAAVVVFVISYFLASAVVGIVFLLLQFLLLRHTEGQKLE